MKGLHLFLIAAVAALAACGGGSSGGGGTTPPTPTPVTHYTVALHWEPASNVGLGSLFRRSTVRRVETVTGSTIIIGSGNGGTSAYDVSDPAYVTVSVSPAPQPSATASFSTTSADVQITPTPIPATPDPSASPAVVVVANASNIASTDGTLTANVGGTTATDNIAIYKMLALVAPNSGSPTAPDAIGFSFDSNCAAVPQTMTAAADIYLTYSSSSTVSYPAGGIAIAHGIDVTTLTATDWQNAGTSSTLDGLGNVTPADDTIVFKTSTGRIVFISLNSWGGDSPSASAAYMNGLYGCLN